jgi:hypothetical protein
MGESSSSVSLYSRRERSSMRPPRSEIEPVSSAVSIVDARGLVQRDLGHLGFGQRGTRGGPVPAGRRGQRDFSPSPVSAGWAV